MKISYVTTYDAKDVRNWSGLGYYIAQSLKDRLISIDYIGSLREKYKLLFKAKKLVYKSLFHKMYLRDREPLILKNYAHQIKKQLSTDASIVFSPGTIPIAYLECHQPIVFWTDATFAGMINFYPEFSNLCKETIDNGNTMERLALERCKLAIYTSEWAAKTAIENYGVEPEKVKIVPFGANIQHSDRINDIQTILDLRSRNKCKLLFLGIDWFRKGGDIALEVTKQLNQAGIGTELTIAGCHPPLQEYLPSYVKVLGFVSKSTQDGQQLINRLLAESHFLILPSRAECYGVVFCEANSFAVPCISTDVGGISTVVKDGLNGKLFSTNTNVADYCSYISDIFSNYSQYRALALSAFNEYQSRLNWSVAGKTVNKLLSEIS
ncbi:group 1 glycosyl transferase [Chroococcidiopsis sp. CCALA 051]|uniref:glycosyltransferase family 4 protein n=1 Tax=Chroococcidiopsis sp. CCALA 051 TaxID=869949 RepID=UPI000D0DBD4D|nr:glycosyltransferase family 4 protein [Chroococcidiopsis sp. CCALA 051]PSM45864.1 group 1 glycosyl transferase [Chroococcidiopsis sp. CCALA 051]